MILGIGSDITDIRRIEKVIKRHGERFLGRILNFIVPTGPLMIITPNTTSSDSLSGRMV